ncbi:regulator of nonsense transcripts UPF2-like [Silene latifolia]|uniref:regulator of nonsense transcripts UPF2-like n=1 Tax=Silene latifolia TaxID=37657 RepID=UPI003D77AB36
MEQQQQQEEFNKVGEHKQDDEGTRLPDVGCRSGGEHGKQDNEEAVARIDELKKSIEAKMSLRQSNLKPERPDPAFLRTLDSSIKRNTAVIKKLKVITEEQRESLMDELRGVNMSKFVTEAVAAICDAKLKSSDILAAVQICSLLHQRYPDFSSSLSQGLLKVFFPGKVAEDLEADKNSKAMKKRSTLKLLLELYFVGVIEDSNIFINIIKDLASVEHLKDRDATQTNLSLLATFARQGRVFLGLPLSGPELNEEFYRELSVTADQKKFIKIFHGYYDTITEVLQAEHASLRHLEHENAKILNFKGELTDDNASSYEKLRKSYDNLYRGVLSLAEAIDMQPPVMPEDGHTTRVTTGDDSASSATGKESSTIEPVWDDEDTRAFYECLPDLRAFVPAVLLGEAESKGSEQPAKLHEQSADVATESDHSPTATEAIAESSSGSGVLEDGKTNEKSQEKDAKGKDKDDTETKDAEKDKGKEKDTDKKGDKEKGKKGLDSTNLDSLLQRLPGCVSRDLIDQLTVEFCYLNSKSNRKKLVRALFNVPRTSLELLPYYSRMVATLSTCMKDISSMLLQLLEEEFNFLTNKKDQMNIETKIRNIRFIGELCKFKIAPAGLVFSCLKACLDDFSHHNIDVACNLLETCGRFLYRSPETNVRMANMLEILMRLKNVKNLDPRHSTLVENAYYLCKPPERPARISKIRPPLHQYIRKLLFSDLDKSSIEHVLRQLRKLPWSECEPYLLKCFLKVHRGKYGQIHLIASLTAGLSYYHDHFSVSVVDEVLEEIRLGLEVNDYGMQQRRLAHMRFLGELYNYKHVDTSVIFETLYLILVFGHGTPEHGVLDPPEDCFRIRMVITLLETCGHYFDRGSSRRKLDRFLIHFQRYTLGKGVLPLDIEFDLQDLYADLRPNMTRYMSIDEVNTALAELEEHEVKANTKKQLEIENRSNSITQTNTARGQRLANGVDQNGGVHDVTGDSDTDTGSGSVGAAPHDDDDDLDDENHEAGSEAEDEEDDDEEGGLASDEDGEIHFRQKAPNTEEEDDFDRELKALMQESLESRKLELRTRPTLDMKIPMSIFESSSKDHHGRVGEGESGSDTLDEENEGNRDVRVKVLVKRGHKQQTKQMYIPQECSLVRGTKQKEYAELEEKQDIKRLVLEYNDREEEEINGINNQVGGWTQAGVGRYLGRGSTWDVSGGRHSGARSRFHHHSGGGYYYGRRR